MAFRNSKIVLILLQLFAFWSVGRWYFLRLSTSGDESWGILALAAICFLSFKGQTKNAQNINFYLIIASIIIFAISFPFLPPLLRAVIAVTSLTLTISDWRFGRKFHFGIWSLFLLSLPIVASMQFYLGFPMRIIIGEATAFLLKLNGLVVFRDGVCLHFGEKLIWIDAPCSGVKMLWAGFFLTSLLITIYQFNFRKSVLAFFSALGIILLGNIFRATGLFYLEAELIKMPNFAHQAIGVSAFVLTCIGIVFTILKIRNHDKRTPKTQTNSIFQPGNFQQIIFVAVCLSAFVTPFIFVGKETVKTNEYVVSFPKEFDGKLLKQLELSEREQFFLNDFPGEIRRFTDGNRELIIRYVATATRKLHPASDCFSAIGYSIKPLPLKIDDNQQKWSCFRATKDNESLNVCERIYSENGKNWTDVSSWYWSAISEETGQGYWAVTVAETAP
ncbi:MAG TPA: archaeosortase/exosortase family protein [Pyrinomonadaceae bacterium]|nr:archaeosortase/exosortase family protein [Pyrinomonadaceae bacterium]